MLLTVVFRLIFRLLPGCLLLCALLPALAGRPPAHDSAWQAYGFDACALPCFVGINPGKTAFRQSPVLLFRNLPAIEPRIYNSGTAITFWANGQRLNGSLRDEGGAVGEIRLNVTMPLAGFLSVLRSPDCLLVGTPENPQRRIVVFWVRDSVSIGAVLDTETAVTVDHTHILALWMRKGAPDDCSRRDSVAWRGFAPLWAYRR